ncbi:MAG: flagellar type III secretion system pore protein FliP [Desulfobacteraceae bacterium]|nr:flagellar type III secretion system pore protein FliP [Desulfobacteraceae bacterium]
MKSTSKIQNSKLCWLRILPLLGLLLLLIFPHWAAAADPANSNNLIRIEMAPGQSPGKVNVVMQIFLLMTILSLAPSILIMVTCFTRIAIVLSLLRQAIGSNQLPPTQIIMGLTLFLTIFVMTPVWQAVHKDALKPYLDNQLSGADALKKAETPIRQFMIKQTREKDLALLVEIAKLPRPKNIDEVPTTVLIPAFMISELKTAFQIGFMLYIPFLIIDMVVASVLLSMGMMMLPPVMISLPFKLMIFVLTDGWYLIIGSLVKSFVV